MRPPTCGAPLDDRSTLAVAPNPPARGQRPDLGGARRARSSTGAAVRPSAHREHGQRHARTGGPSRCCPYPDSTWHVSPKRSWNTTPALLLAVSIPWRAAFAAVTNVTKPSPGTSHTHLVSALALALKMTGDSRTTVAIDDLMMVRFTGSPLAWHRDGTWLPRAPTAMSPYRCFKRRHRRVRCQGAPDSPGHGRAGVRFCGSRPWSHST